LNYQSISFYGHKEYREFLEKNQDIEIDFVNVVHDQDVIDSLIVVVTFRRVKN
jgi:hypothetical protein